MKEHGGDDQIPRLMELIAAVCFSRQPYHGCIASFLSASSHVYRTEIRATSVFFLFCLFGICSILTGPFHSAEWKARGCSSRGQAADEPGVYWLQPYCLTRVFQSPFR